MQAYLADVLAGRRSLLITPTNTQAADLAGRLRTELLRLGHVRPDPQAARLRDGNHASVGDLVQTRRHCPASRRRWAVPARGYCVVMSRPRRRRRRRRTDRARSTDASCSAMSNARPRASVHSS